MVQAIANDRGGIGLVSLSLGGLNNVRLVPIRVLGKMPVAPSKATIDSNDYPLVRPLFVVFASETKTLSTQPLLKEFASYITSTFGQADVIKEGFRVVLQTAAPVPLAGSRRVNLTLVANDGRPGGLSFEQQIQQCYQQYLGRP